MKWLNFLHFYQPPSISQDTIDWVCENSYNFIVKVLKENPQAKIIANINASLLEHLEKQGKGYLIADFRELIYRGQIELVLSAAYHPVLALIPFKESVRQIEKDREIIKHFFPEAKVKGFFFPEMVYDARVSRYLKSIGVEWIIIDELAYQGRFGLVDYNKKYLDKNSGLAIIFRNRNYSNGFPPKEVLDLADKSDEVVIISGTDAELYGAKHVDYEGDFYRAVSNERVVTTKVDDYVKGLSGEELVSPKVVSWDTTEEDFDKGESLNLWRNPNNRIHNKLWGLTNYVLKVVEANQQDENYYWARWRLDRGLSSCVYWWASEIKVSSWDSPAWHPDQVEAGALDLIRGVRSLKSISYQQRIKAERKYLNLIKVVWERHWERYHS